MLTKLLSYAAWIQAITAMAGSLYFSEVIHLPPCSLCWYQRILLYPLVGIIAVGILRKDKNLPWYVLPFSFLGILVAIYQVLLQQGLISEKLVPCANGVSCSVKYGVFFGFVTLPMLSLLAFIVITGCMLLVWRKQD